MKIVLMLGGCLALLIIVVIVVGSLLPSRHIATRSAAFHATPEELYGLIAGPQSWRPEVVRSEMLSDSAGRELQQETTRDGKSIVYEITDRVPPTNVTRRIATTGLPYSGEWTYSIQSSNGMSLVRITENGEVHNPIFRFVSRFVLGYTKTMDQYLQALGSASGQKM